jgi:hypothetical protein
VNAAPLLSPADRFAQLMALMSEMTAARSHRGGLPGSLIVLLWSRFQRMAGRFAFLVARLEAGVRPRVRRPVAEGAGTGPVIAHSAPHSAPHSAAHSAARPMELPDGGFDRLPAWLYRRSGWMAQLVPGIGVCGSRLQSLLDDPAFVALAAASPPIARLLRSLCRMLAVDPGPALPPPPRRSRPPPPPRSRSLPRVAETAASRGGVVRLPDHCLPDHCLPDHCLPDHYPPFTPPPRWARRRGRPIPKSWLGPG